MLGPQGEGERRYDREIRKLDQGHVWFSWSTSQVELPGERISKPRPSPHPNSLSCPTHIIAPYLGSLRRQVWLRLHKTHVPPHTVPKLFTFIQPSRGPQTQKKHVHTFLVGTLIFKNSASLASTCHGACIRTKMDPWLLPCNVQRKKKWKHLQEHTLNVWLPKPEAPSWCFSSFWGLFSLNFTRGQPPSPHTPSRNVLIKTHRAVSPECGPWASGGKLKPLCSQIWNVSNYDFHKNPVNSLYSYLLFLRQHSVTAAICLHSHIFTVVKSIFLFYCCAWT